MEVEEDERVSLECESKDDDDAGKSCDAVEANRTIAQIRKVVAKLYSQDTADKVRILYGGSVKPSTIVEQMAQSDIDGALVGGASLKADSFVEIIKGAM